MFVARGPQITVETPPANPGAPLQGAGVSDLVALPGGGFSILWGVRVSSFDPTEASNQLKTASYGAGGGLLGRHIVIDEPSQGTFVTGRLSVVGPGDLAAFTAQGINIDVRGHSFSSAETDPPRDAVPPAAVNPTLQDSLGLGGRSFLLYGADDAATGARQMFGRFFDAANAALGDPFRISRANGLDQTNGDAARLANGNLVVSYTQETASDVGDIRAVVISAASGVPVVRSFAANTMRTGLQTEVQVAGLSSGGFALAWVDQGGSDGSGFAIRARVFDDAGRAVSGDFLVNTTVSDSQTGVQIAALTGGRFAVVWDDGNGGGSIRGQIYDRLGNRIGTETVLQNSAPPDVFEQGPTIETLTDGRLLLAWTRDIEQEGVLAQAYDVGSAGTPGGDVLNGAEVGRVLEGLGGDDTLIGTGFDDVFIGGPGKDTSAGGAGEDRFQFRDEGESRPGAGRDIIRDFKAGLDTLDLAAIDANTRAGAAGNQRFEFIGTAAFSGNAGDPQKRGELRAFQVDKPGAANDRTIIEADVDGDRAADLQIELFGRPLLTAADFLL